MSDENLARAVNTLYAVNMVRANGFILQRNKLRLRMLKHFSPENTLACEYVCLCVWFKNLWHKILLSATEWSLWRWSACLSVLWHCVHIFFGVNHRLHIKIELNFCQWRRCGLRLIVHCTIACGYCACAKFTPIFHTAQSSTRQHIAYKAKI